MNNLVLRSRPRAGARRGAFVSRLALEALETRTVPALAALPAASLDYDPSHILVRLRDGVPATVLGAFQESLGSQLYRVALAPGQNVPQAVAAFSQRDDVLFAQPDTLVSAAAIPNDARFGEQWGLHNVGQGGGTPDADIDAPAGWDASTGRGRTIVAVIDSGIDTNHPDLVANLWRNPGEVANNGIDDNGDGYIDDVYGWNFLANNANVTDDYGHGTHVAGIIGAVGGNGIGISGVDPNVKLMALKFLNAGGNGLLSNAARAVTYAVAHGANVINLSTGGVYDAALQNAIADARSAGVVVVTAAGNQARNTDQYPTYPSGYQFDNIVAVGAVDYRNLPASFSNWGANSVDLFAPGTYILSTYRNGGYRVMSGTSMAAPFVAGTVAMIRDLQPTWSYQQVIGHLLGTTSRLTALQGRAVTNGVLNFGRAILTLPPATNLPPFPTPTPTPTDLTGPRVTAATFNDGTTLSTVRVGFSEAVNPAAFTANDVVLTGPAGTVPVASVVAVAGTNNTLFDVTFVGQTVAGNYALALGPDVRDVAGNKLDQNQNGVNGEVADVFRTQTTLTPPPAPPPSGGQTFTSADAPRTIIDMGTMISSLVVDRDISIGAVRVSLNVTHPYDADLLITLQSPTGRRVLLFNRRGGAGDNLTDTVLADAAAQPISTAHAPFAGTFKPDGPLSSYAGLNARGIWRLIVEDRMQRMTGTLNGWSLTFDASAGAASGASVAMDAATVATLTGPRVRH